MTSSDFVSTKETCRRALELHAIYADTSSLNLTSDLFGRLDGH